MFPTGVTTNQPDYKSQRMKELEEGEIIEETPFNAARPSDRLSVEGRTQT
jgi:hypothetical protein